jgi:protein ImuB
MLWLCLALPQLPLEARLTVDECGSSEELRANENALPIVITASAGSSRWIVCCNAAAERRHLKAPMNYTVALAVCPQVTQLERDLRAERSALERLAAWAYQFSSTVILETIDPNPHYARQAAVWLEIGASLKLFGGFKAFIATVEKGLQALGYTYRLGIAPTLEGAALLARAGVRIAVTSLAGLRTQLDKLPLQLLNFPVRTIQQLHSSGVRTIGLLLSLPRDALAKRFGPETANLLDRIVGLAADPRPTFALPPRYDAHFGFDFEVKRTEALLFPLKRMLQEFVGYLRGLDVSVQAFDLFFEHRDRGATHLQVGLSVPDRDAEKFLALIREQLERVELPASTIGLRLCSDRFTAASTHQADLFSHTEQQGEELAHTLDRLVARLGEDRIFGLRVAADHRPEDTWRKTSIELTMGERSARAPSHHVAFPTRPLWLLPEPKPLELALTSLVSGPERIESGWWDGRDVQRDYYIVRTSSGAELWVFRDLARNGAWYLHGFWS